MIILPPLQTDFYKTSHPAQNPKGTTLIYSNLTARSSRIEGLNHVVFFGLQYYIKEYLIDQWNEHFFNKRKSDILRLYKSILEPAVGPTNLDHIVDLHDLGYLPIHIKALKEGTLVPIGVPLLTIQNTHENF